MWFERRPEKAPLERKSAIHRSNPSSAISEVSEIRSQARVRLRQQNQQALESGFDRDVRGVAEAERVGNSSQGLVFHLSFLGCFSFLVGLMGFAGIFFYRQLDLGAFGCTPNRYSLHNIFGCDIWIFGIVFFCIFLVKIDIGFGAESWTSG